jgi:hypothetical protein
MQKLVSEIKNISNLLKEKTSEELEILIQKTKKRSKTESLENLLVDWFAITQEMSFRTIGLRHFDTQLLAGIILHEGKIVEMKTGEGKTLASTLAVALNALSSKGVHVVTVNDYLAERDQKLMGKIYTSLGLSVGLVKSTSTTAEKQKSYSSDITYLTNSELVFDYLRDSSSYNLNEVVQNPFNFCIIDEIDSILIDEARTPLILSTSKSNNNKNKLYLAKKIASILSKGIDFEIDENDDQFFFKILNSNKLEIESNSYDCCNVISLDKTSIKMKGKSMSEISVCKKFGRILLFKEICEWLNLPEGFQRRCSKLLQCFDPDNKQTIDVLSFMVNKEQHNKRQRLCVTFRGILKIFVLIKLWLYTSLNQEQIDDIETKLNTILHSHHYFTYRFVDLYALKFSSSSSSSSSTSSNTSSSNEQQSTFFDTSSDSNSRYNTRNTNVSSHSIIPNQFELNEVLSDLETEKQVVDSSVDSGNESPLLLSFSENDDEDSDTETTDTDEECA